MAAGMFLVAMGTLWTLQGAGWLDWPAGSVMLAQRQWLGYGLGAAGLGGVIIWLATRRRRG